MLSVQDQISATIQSTPKVIGLIKVQSDIDSVLLCERADAIIIGKNNTAINKTIIPDSSAVILFLLCQLPGVSFI